MSGKKKMLSTGLPANTIDRRARILEALSSAAEYFLRATPNVWEQNVLEVLRKMGEARGSSRVYLCKNTTETDGRVTVQLRYEWNVSSGQQVFPEEAEARREYQALGLARWVQLLKLGSVICESVDRLPSEERQWNVALGAQAVVIIPVYVGDEWWGYLGFEDYTHDQECSKFEIDALKAVAITFGEAIKRKRIEEELEEEKASVEQKVTERTKELEEKTLALEQARKEVEEALLTIKQEKARLTASIHSLSMGFLMTNLDGEVMLFNHAVNDILGKSDVPWTLERLQERFGDRLPLKAQIERCAGEVKEIQVEEIAYQEKYLRVYMTPIKIIEAGGQVIGVVILIDDITDEKKLERARDEFFAVAAHELRTPLTAIKGYAEMIEHYYPQSVQNTDVKVMVDDIITSSSRLLELVSEYLDVSRVEMQKVQVVKEVFNLVAVVKRAMANLSMTAKEKKLVWELQLVDDVQIMVKADPGRTEQILINLLGNAIKNTETGGIYVKVYQDGMRVRVACYDTGVGIKPEDQPFLFQKFRRLGDRVYEGDISTGTGMGLYISRLLAEAMGGWVYLEKSAPGQGSGFVLELPVG
jgi:PAS domain S-box-containing protein